MRQGGRNYDSSNACLTDICVFYDLWAQEVRRHCLKLILFGSKELDFPISMPSGYHRASSIPPEELLTESDCDFLSTDRKTERRTIDGRMNEQATSSPVQRRLLHMDRPVEGSVQLNRSN